MVEKKVWLKNFRNKLHGHFLSTLRLKGASKMYATIKVADNC